MQIAAKELHRFTDNLVQEKVWPKCREVASAHDIALFPFSPTFLAFLDMSFCKSLVSFIH